MEKVFAVVLALLFVLGCVSTAVDGNKTGFLQGRISIGPICSVERNPPDPNCQPTEGTYIAHPLTVYSASGIEIMQFHGDKDGNYKIELPERYLLDHSDIAALRKIEKVIDIECG